MTSSQVPESSSTPDESESDAAARRTRHRTEDVDSYPEGVFEQGNERPAGEEGEGVFEQGHPEPVGEGVFRQGHPERSQGTGVYDQDDEDESEN